MDSRASTPTRRSVLPVFIALIVNVMLAAPVMTLVASPAGPAPVYADSHVVVTLEGDVAGCMGVRTTPGSENTTKRLIGGTLQPGGTAVFRFTFPAETDGNPGQEEWEITDCVFLNGEPLQKYTVTALSNDVSPVVIEFALTIPADAPIGSEYCNYAKTTETPSDAQASNRKAGPACFIVGGAIRVLKVDQAGAALAGATFSVACDWPNVTAGTFLPDTILTATPNGSINGGASSETIDSVDDGSFSRTVVTGSDGAIGVNGPDGTVCTFTETAAPNGYLAPVAPDDTVTLTVQGAGEQATHTFVNTLAAPALAIEKTADATPIAAGEEASFTISVWNTGGASGNASATEVILHDELPAGLEWDWEVLAGSADCLQASSVEENGVVRQSLDCELGTLGPSDRVDIRVFADTTPRDCGLLENSAWAEASNAARVEAMAEVTVLCSEPTLVIDKAADADVITITIDDGGQSGAPAIVTWTLTYTLTNGPVTNAVITDELPAGLVYVDGSASDGGSYDAATDTLTWTFPTLDASGSVTFQTEVEPETISRAAPTVNVAVIDSDETPADEGQDQVTVTVEQELGGNPTPTPTPDLPDTATAAAPDGERIVVPVELLAVAFLSSLGAMALVNVRARSRRR